MHHHREEGEMKNTTSLGIRLRNLRAARKISQRKLAQMAGISPNSISLIEREEISPSVATLQNLATALNIRMSYFFEDEVVLVSMVRKGYNHLGLY